MTGKLIAAFGISFIVTAVTGAFLVPFLRRVKAGQSIREDGPVWHMTKAGTPTMGGLMFILGIAAGIIFSGREELARGEYGHLFAFAFALIFGGIGFLDDYEKLRRKQNLGLTASKKFLLQISVALAFVYLLRRYGYLTPNLYIPFANLTIPLPEVVYFSFATFVIVGTVNSVNLTDGVDGLATGTSLPVALCYVVVAMRWGENFLALGIFASALVGGLLGFLLYNFNPAKVFMGDTGALFLGGAVCAMAFAFDMPMILVTLGIMYIIETLSDIIQVAYFKFSGGKRVFKMAPFHHHLEMGGWSGKKWSEKKLFALFTCISALFAVISYMAVRNRYGF